MILRKFTISVKNVLSAFSYASKKVQGFSSDRDINVIVISALSPTRLSKFFEIFIFSQDIWENVHYVPEINLLS